MQEWKCSPASHSSGFSFLPLATSQVPCRSTQPSLDCSTGHPWPSQRKLLTGSAKHCFPASLARCSLEQPRRARRACSGMAACSRSQWRLCASGVPVPAQKRLQSGGTGVAQALEQLEQRKRWSKSGGTGVAQALEQLEQRKRWSKKQRTALMIFNTSALRSSKKFLKY